MTFRCRLCGQADPPVTVLIPRGASNIARLLRREQLDEDRPVRIEVVQCPTCEHVQLNRDLEEDYYDDYFMGSGERGTLHPARVDQADRFVRTFQLQGKQVCDVGCAEGTFCGLLQERGCLVSAVEPSEGYRARVAAMGVRVLGQYMTTEAFPEHRGTFDAFVTKQVLEHVPDPHDFIRGCRNLLKPGGVGLIDIPSLEMSLEHARFVDFFPDHVSYWSATTLRHLFARNHLEVIQITRVLDGEYLEAWVRRVEAPDLSGIQVAADSLRPAFARLVQTHLASGRRLAVWGAGGKGVLGLATVDPRGIAYVVDSDLSKAGRFLPVSHLEVVPPSRLREDPVDTVVIAALTYLREIVADLRGRHGFTGSIMHLEGGAIIPSESAAA
jgi:2-polyprenyl-3-methyl-5-hydroxy-6-metoxy-1,4-benzoquinol methylase